MKKYWMLLPLSITAILLVGQLNTARGALEASSLSTLMKETDGNPFRSETIKAARNDAKMFIQNGQMTQKLKAAIKEVRELTNSDASNEEIARAIVQGRLRNLQEEQDQSTEDYSPSQPVNLGQ